MAVTSTPIFTQTPKHSSVSISGAAAALASPATTTNLGLLVTAGANGSKILAITFNGIDAACAVGNLYIFVDNDGGSNALELYDSHAVPAIVTVAAGTPPFRKSITYENFILPAGATVYVGTSVADAWSVHCDYGDY